jgi:hypothetical protein
MILNTWIDRQIAKMNINGEEIYVCIYVYGNALLNVSFFKKNEEDFQEILPYDVSTEYRNELIRRIRENHVEKITVSEREKFLQFLDAYHFRASREIKHHIDQTLKHIKVDYIGEIAGMYYIIFKEKNSFFYQAYWIQKRGIKEGYEAGKVPFSFLDFMILDYVHHAKIGEIPKFIRIGESEFVGLKKKQGNTIYVVQIQSFPGSVSASKAYVIKKKNAYVYTLLPIEEVTPEIMEGLQKEGKLLVHQFIREANLIKK